MVLKGRFLALLLPTSLVVVTVAFSRNALDSFDSTKAMLLWLLGLLLLPSFVGLFVGSTPNLKKPNWDVVAVSCFAIAVVLTLVSSDFVGTSVWGQYQRYTGVFTIFFCLVTAAVVRDQVRRHGHQWLVHGVLLSQALVNLYGIIQWLEIDPWEWQTGSFGRLVFSTLGNPNTASAYTSVTMPILMSAMSRGGRLQSSIASVAVASSFFLMPVYGSFQGFVGFAVSALSVFLVLRATSGSFWGWAISAWFLAAFALLTILDEAMYSLIMAAVAGVALSLLKERLSSRNFLLSKRSFGLIFAGTFLTATTFVLLFRERLGDQISDGLSERRFFYSAGWSMFKERPILGWGIETFGFWFTRFRSVENATTLEASITSSVHSVPFGFLISGGLVLALTLLFVIFRFLVAPFRQSGIKGFETDHKFFLLSGWVWFVVSLVSVESIHLFYLFAFVVGGGAVQVRVGNQRNLKNSLTDRAQRRSFVALACGVLLVIVLAPQVSRYFRADAANLRALRSQSEGRISEAVEDATSAVSLAPWNGEYRARLAFVQNQLGNLQQAGRTAVRAAKDSNYPNVLAHDLAVVALNGGLIDEGIDILQLAVENDPFAPSLRLRSRQTLAEVAEFLRSRGDEASAVDLEMWISENLSTGNE